MFDHSHTDSTGWSIRYLWYGLTLLMHATMTKIEGDQPAISHQGGNSNNNNKRKLSSFQNIRNGSPPFIQAEGCFNNAAADGDNHLTMEAILHRYNSLAQTYYADTKRRHIESSQRTLQNTQRMQQLTNLQKMASETHALATNLLRSEQQLYRENQRERQDIEKELKKAEQEKALAEDFLSKIGFCSFTAGGENSMHVGDLLVDDERGTIGGVPRKFLDLSHFPQFRKGGDVYKSEDEDDIVYTQEDSKKRSRHIIDCTEEDAQKQSSSMHLEESYPTRIIPFPPQSYSQAMETTSDVASSSKTQKKNTKRIYITDASLAHVNGTYIQEVGCYNNAPVFVLAGPPRKFMGFDCSVVLRRESISPEEYKLLSSRDDVVVHSKNNNNTGGGAPHHYFIWKIGLAPAHRVTHPRLIGYYFAYEDARDCAAVMSCMDLMGEDDDSSYFEPPARGWRVFHESGQGRTSRLKVNYEE